MRERTRKCLQIMLLLVFVGSTFLLVRHLADKKAGADLYGDAQLLASGEEFRNRSAQSQKPEQTVPEQTESTPVPQSIWVPEPVMDDPNMEEMASVDLEALRTENPDVVGWIRIPGTKINYPLMIGQDNEFYLNNTWNKMPNIMGSIFLECNNNPDLTDYNTIVYGHNMSNGTMFAALHRYAEKGFRENHPYVYIAYDGGVLRYEVFSAYRAEVDSAAYGLSYQQEQTRANLVAHALDNSQIEADIVPQAQDRILTLSTCSGAGYSSRWVVHARLKMVEVL